MVKSSPESNNRKTGNPKILKNENPEMKSMENG